MRKGAYWVKGYVFAIEEFSTFDGPGIRSTIFLKGCPLRCSWCHNPEGQLFQPQLVKNPNGCIGCGRCLNAAESTYVCPNHLIRISGICYTPEALCEKLEKNIFLLQQNGGGITFSGGEPLAQPSFLLGCLQQLEGKVHRAIQTIGYCDPAIWKQILSQIEYCLFDLKIMDKEAHERYTGVSNDWILKNFQLLVQSGKDFCVRIPLIPGVTDTVENTEAMADFLEQYGVKEVELLPYNKLAGSKYAMVGREYTPDFDPTVEVVVRKHIFQIHHINVVAL